MKTDSRLIQEKVNCIHRIDSTSKMKKQPILSLAKKRLQMIPKPDYKFGHNRNFSVDNQMPKWLKKVRPKVCYLKLSKKKNCQTRFQSSFQSPEPQTLFSPLRRRDSDQSIKEEHKDFNQQTLSPIGVFASELKSLSPDMWSRGNKDMFSLPHIHSFVTLKSTIQGTSNTRLNSPTATSTTVGDRKSTAGGKRVKKQQISSKVKKDILKHFWPMKRVTASPSVVME